MSTGTQAIAVEQGVQLVSSGLNTTNLDWPNLTTNRVGLPALLSHERYRGNSNLEMSYEKLETCYTAEYHLDYKLPFNNIHYFHQKWQFPSKNAISKCSGFHEAQVH